MSGFQGPFGPSDTPTILPGVTPTNGGAAGRLLFDTGSFVQESSALRWDNTNNALTISGGTLTGATSFPVLNLSQMWNNATTVFTGAKLNVTNTASAAGSLLLDLQIGGVSKVNVDSIGALNFGASYYISQTAGYLALGAIGSNPSFGIASNNITAFVQIGFSSVWNNAADTFLTRDGAANTLAIRNGTNANSIRAYNTSSSANANFERGVYGWTDITNVLLIGTQAGGTGVARYMKLTSATKAIQYDTTVVASLPSAATAGAGARAFVTDSLTPAFGSAVTGGGAVGVPVYSTGSTWNVG